MAEDRSVFSFSTSWNWRNSNIGSELMEEILSLGFRKVELNYKISEEALATIRPMISRGQIEVPSVHNVFPDVKDERFDTDSRLLGYADETLRRRAVSLTIRSVEFAAELGAKAVVVHPGVMPPDGSIEPGPSGRTPPAYDADLKALHKSGKRRGDAEYDALFDEFLDYRSRVASPEFDRVIRSLTEIVSEIERRKLGVWIGLENRPMCWQLPHFDEFARVFTALDGAPIGLWFDTGHGAMMRHMGFFDDRLEARKYVDKLVGVHIHDVDGVDDHFAPYTREGLDGYLELIEAAPIKVLELGKKNPREDVERGADALARVLRERAEIKARGN